MYTAIDTLFLVTKTYCIEFCTLKIIEFDQKDDLFISFCYARFQSSKSFKKSRQIHRIVF